MIIGVSDHNGWAALVTVARDGTLHDRRRLTLVDEGLPTMPHHHDAQGLPLAEALELVERVRLSAEQHAKLGLAAVAEIVPGIQGIALRQCPQLPPTVAERLADYRAQNVADTVMYRQTLAGAAVECGWAVHWYDPRRVVQAAGDALHMDFEAHFLQMRSRMGAPWGQDQKLAMAAAIVAAQAAR